MPILPGMYFRIPHAEVYLRIIVSGIFLGFQHPHGEIHIDDNGIWNACAGRSLIWFAISVIY